MNWLERGEVEVNGIEDRFTEIDEFNKKPNKIRQYLQGSNKDSVITPHAVNYWRMKLQFEISQDTWLLPRITTKEVRLRELQWKIMHNLYPTNILLKKMGICRSENCNYCQEALDTLQHFYYECPLSKILWKYVERKVCFTMRKTITFSVTEILFGVQDVCGCSKRDVMLINHFVLIGKMCISKLKKSNLTIPLDILFELECDLRKCSRKE